MPGWAANLRASLIESNALVLNEDGSSLRLTSDYVFRSPSAAAATLLGRSAAGPIEWKDEAGTTLKELRERAVEASED